MALVVEDGTGLATADAYLTIAEVTAYVTRVMRGDTVWSGATTAAQEQAIWEATQLVDVLYSTRWRGARVAQAQSLAWPRSGGRDDDGYAILSTSVPQRVKDATAELAWRAINIGGVDTSTGDSTKLLADDAVGSNVESESVQVGSIKTSTAYVGGKSSGKRFNKIDKLLVSHLQSGGTISRA